MKLVKWFLIVGLLSGCANFFTATGENGINMGDSYEKVLETLKRKNNRIIKTIDQKGIKAEGYSDLMKQCVEKFFIFQEKEGLQRTQYTPLKQSYDNGQCR